MFRNTKENFLLKAGVTLFCCAGLFFILLYSELEKLNVTPEIQKIQSFPLLIFLSLIIAPIFEELTFRSPFAKFKYSIFLSTFGIVGYILISKNYYILILLSLFAFLYILQKLRKIIKNRFFLYIFSSIIFSLIHYKLNDFGNFLTVIPMFFQFSVGLILIWITINFGLVKSMLFHFLYNFIFIFVLFISLQFPDTTINTIEQNGNSLIWSKTQIFDSEGTKIIIPNDHEISAKNVSIKGFLELNNLVTDSLIIKDEFLMHYNIKISGNTKTNLDSKIITNLLLKGKLIEKSKNKK